jgi:hypothetical protein
VERVGRPEGAEVKDKVTTLKSHGIALKVRGRLIRIASVEAEPYEFLDDAERTIEELRSLNDRVDLLTFIPKLSQTAWRLAYTTEDDNLAVLRVSTFAEWWSSQIDGKTRNMVRRAEKKGVTVREVPFDDFLVRGISAIYNESPSRQGKRFWHYGKDLDTVRRENTTFLERSTFVGAFLDNNLIGFAKLVRDSTGEQAGLMQILSMIQHRDKAPTNALLAQAVRSCAERGIGNLVYAKFSYGNKERDSLIDFKENNGFRRVDIPRYYVALSLLGTITLQLGLHHSLRSRIPEPLMLQLRRLRAIWVSKSIQVQSSSNSA